MAEAPLQVMSRLQKAEKLEQAMTEPGGPASLDPQAWLEALARTYTTEEQLAVHEGKATAGPQASEITFF